MTNFLIQLHLNMFFVLLTAGTICSVWGLGLLVASRGRKVAGVVPTEPEAMHQQEQEVAEVAPKAKGKASVINPLFRSALTVTGCLALIQAALGGLLLLLHAGSPKDSLHYVYGIVVLVAIPVAFTYLSGKPERARRDLLYLVIAAVIVAAAAVRAYVTGHP